MQLNRLLFNEMQEKHPRAPIPIIVTERYETWGLTNGDTGVLDPVTQQLRFMNGEILHQADFPIILTTMSCLCTKVRVVNMIV